jgi:hypothetical protein
MIYGGGEPRLNDIGKGQPKNADKILPQSHIIHQKLHAVWPEREHRPSRWEAGE